MLDLFFAPEALDELRAARRWYESRREGLGSAFELAVQAALNRARLTPQGAPEVAPPFRKLLVRGYPYDIYYTIEPSALLVVLIVHTSRDPAWTSRRLGTH